MGRLTLFCLSGVITTVALPAHAQTSERNPPPSAAAGPAAAPAPAPRSQPWREAKERLPTPENPESERQTREWYGWQNLLCDGLAAGLIAFGEETEPVVAGLGLAVIGSPIVHFAHSNTTGGLISFAIRGTSLGLFFLGGFLIFSNDEDPLGSTAQALGVLSLVVGGAGTLAAIVVDASLLAYDTTTRPKQALEASLAPWIDPKRGNYGVHVSLAL